MILAPTESPDFRSSSMNDSSFATTAGFATEKRIVTHDIPALERHFMRPKLAQVATDHDAILLPEPFLGNRCCRHSHGRFTRRRAPAAAMVANAVLLPIGVVRVTGPEGIDQIAVVPAAGVFVSNEQRDGGAGGLAFKDTGEDFDGIGFLPLRDVAGGAWLAPIEIVLDVIDGEGQTGRTAIHDTANRRPVALAE